MEYLSRSSARDIKHLNPSARKSKKKNEDAFKETGKVLREGAIWGT